MVYRMGNDFINNMNLVQIGSTKSYELCKTAQGKDLKSLHKQIDADFPPICREEKYNAIYCYSLRDAIIDYPNGKSNVLYIGETEGEINNGVRKMSFRFVHCMNGKDSKINECLKFYYNSGRRLVLEIYTLTGDKSRKEIEKMLRNSFLRKYAALPMADGASIKK